MSNILILCTGNSCRSQMAEGWLNYFTNDDVKVFSAGTKPESINKFAIRVMSTVGIDISKYTSNHADEYTQFNFDYVFTVCDKAKEICPIYPQAKQMLHHSFSDPADATGSEEEQLKVYVKVRDELKYYFKDFASTIG
mgnify:CR=1 FL=1